MSTGTVHNTKGDLFTSTNVDDFEVPGGRDEVWRFLSLRALRGLSDGSFAPAADQRLSIEAPAGVTHERVATDDERVLAAGLPFDRVAAQAWASASAADRIVIPAKAELAEPVKVTITGCGEGVTSFGLTAIEVEPEASATVILRYEGTGTHADNLSVILGDGARLTLITDANWDSEAVHVSQHHLRLGRDATLHHTVVTFGGKLVRVTPRVDFTAPGGDAELLGLYFADSGQYIENRLLVDHSVPSCRSNVLYKGALQAGGEGETRADREARTCWVGDVLIRANALNTDTYETNRNLVLTEGARADAIPNLEIETGEIAGAGHAATVGRFDDEHMFYLQSRGIPEEDARRMIIRGFFTDVIHRIPVESVRSELEQRVTEELATVAVTSAPNP